MAVELACAAAAAEPRTPADTAKRLGIVPHLCQAILSQVAAEDGGKSGLRSIAEQIGRAAYMNPGFRYPGRII